MLGCTRSSELQWNNEEGYRWAELPSGYWRSTGFRSLSSSRTGITFSNRITTEEIGDNRHYLNGSGVAAGDIDGDGFIDLYFAGLSNSNKLYRNLGGMTFEDITSQAGVEHEGIYSTGATFSDVNGNGHLDLIVTAIHGENVLYINDGTGRFHRDDNSGLGEAEGSNTIALSDVTGDGYPDLYISQYKEKSVKDIYTTAELEWDQILSEPMIRPTDHYTLVPPFDRHYELVRQNGMLAGIVEIGEYDAFYINKGGRFEKVNDTDRVFLDEYGQPLGLSPDWGLTAKFHDLNNDGLPDLYVCNDFHTPDRIWLNQGHSGDPQGVTFRAIKWQAIRNLSYSCMAVDFADINKDGRQDIFTTEMLDPEHVRRLRQASSDDHVSISVVDIEARPMYNRNSLYLQREDGTYAETAWMSGVEATGWSWATKFMDVDLDGYEDLIIATGYSYDILDIDAQLAMIRNQRNMDEHFMEFISLAEPLKLPNRILRNNGTRAGSGEVPTFTDVSHDWGFTAPDVSQGMALADLNNDGAPDVILNRMNEEAAIYENRTRAPRIAVRLRGKVPNTQALGAKVELTGGPVHQSKQITAGGDYSSGSDLMMVFSADPGNLDHTVLITWPDGTKSRLGAVEANRIYEIDQNTIGMDKGAEKTDSAAGNAQASMFTDITDSLRHTHHEDPFDDFNLQPLLPMRLSQQSPGVAWLDVTGNEMDDLLITTGKGGQFTVLENTGDGQFQRKEIEGLSDPTAGDQTAVLGWREDGSTRLLVGSSNFEQGTSAAPSAFAFRMGSDGTVEKDSIQGVHSTTGPIAAADVTGNGYLDIFIGGRFKPGQYPADADSRFFRNESGALLLDRLNSQTFSELGLVTGAVFTDINLDGKQELLLSTEWGTLRLFESNDGIFREITSERGLDKWSGWWNGVSTGDFNNDGLPDIIATNLGLNTQYQIRSGQPLRLYYTNQYGSGGTAIIEAYPGGQGAYLPRRRLYAFQQQNVRFNRMSSHNEFVNSTLPEILGDRYEQTPYKEINTLEHSIFINTGSGFEAHPLPQEAQLSMALHPGVADVDNDGNEDLFLSQNFFAVSEELPRMDSGRGLLLRGDGEGGFIPLSGSEGGIRIYGEQRGAAFNDINDDGKVDLAVSQNEAKTRLFLNRTERAGYRVRLNGPPSNRDGIGSGIRLVYDNGEKGPYREIRSGAGYRSQDSFTQILGAARDVKEIEIYWFDGVRESVPVMDDEMNYVISYPDHE